jgi:hypothetical protein
MVNMFPQILALVVKGSSEGGTVDIGIAPFVLGSLPFVVLISLIVMLTWYHLSKRRFEHQQILAAIEKGTPLSELMPVKQQKKEVNWIKNLTVGIAFLIMGIGMVIIASISKVSAYPDKDAGFGLFIASVIFLELGTASTIRGILLRKYDKALSSDKSALNANNGQ